jgi:3-hydroxybutyryl-CoA dehydrogenase
MINHLGIVGAGTMGTAIAHLAALKKISVQLYDVNETILRRSLERIKADLRKLVNLGKLPPEELAITIEYIRTRTSLPDLGHCDCILEAVVEDIRVKKDLFKHLDSNTKSSVILASTTSTLSITSIASLTRNPERIVGAHFFSPVETTELVEIVKGQKTNVETMERIKEFVISLGKTCILAKDTPGFIVNRISNPLLSEALRLLGENVAEFEQIDRIVKAIGGFPTGPFEMIDQIGVDTVLSQMQSLYNQSFGDTRFRPYPILQRMMESGLLGRKSEKGFYAYEKL